MMVTQMRMNKLVSVSYCINPWEAVALSQMLLSMPGITKDGVDNFRYINEMANLVKSGEIEEFSLVVRVERDRE